MINNKQDKQSTVAMGRYLEEVIDIGRQVDANSKEAINIVEDTSGKLQIIFDDGDNHFSLYEQKIEGWTRIESDMCEAINAEKLEGVKLVKNIAEENKTYVVGELQEEEVPYIGIFTNNVLNKINIEWQSSEELIKEVHISQDKLFMLNYKAHNVEIYDLNTGKFVDRIGENVATFTVIKDKLYEVNFLQKAIQRYDVKTAHLEINVGCEMPIDNNRLIEANDEGGVYLINSEGIFFLAKDDSIAEKIVNGDLSSLSSPSRVLKDAKVCDGTIYSVFLDRSNNQFFFVKYVYHKEVPTVPQNQVNVFSLYDCPTLKQAAQLYKEKHPQTNISFEIAFPDDIGPDYSVYQEADKKQIIENLNLRILAKNAPDIFVLDNLPIESYQKIGLFDDLTEVVEKSSQGEKLLDNIMHTYGVEDKVYALPLRFGIMSAVGEASLVKDGISLEKLTAYQKNHQNERVISSVGPEIFLEKISGVWNNRLFSQEGEVNQEEMKTFLEVVKTLQPLTEGENDCYYIPQDYEGIDELVKNKCKVEIRKIEDQNDLQVLMYAKAHHENALMAPSIEQINNSVYLKEVVGVNSQSSTKEEVKEFLQLALSKDVQQGEFWDGFPVYKQAVKDWILKDNNRKRSFPHYYLWYGDDIERIDFDWGYSDELNDFTQRLDTAEVILPMDSNLLMIIQQESEDYFKGLIEVDEAVKNITGKVKLYLTEQNE
ncbi:MAG: hypothetical protein AB9856_15285 [Cellulosilyticaceae bacterium]